ncbi:MAG: ATP-binding cassette domain-containing protein [Ilumatobacter sp.]|nr:ATP-binding cassette domain-containing protein [Ilumatobacter sp.]
MTSVRFDGVVRPADTPDDPDLDLEFEVEAGELLAIVGPPGSGKSAALHLLVGTDRPTAGRILIDDRCVNALPTRDRGVAMLLARTALYPHRTVAENLGGSLELECCDRTERRRVGRVADALGLTDLLDRSPRSLSPAERRCVALGRAFVRDRGVVVLDDPCAGMGSEMASTVRAGVHTLRRATGSTVLYTTTDPAEALAVGDRIAVMASGTVERIDTPANA